jgi:hypothetical protein
MNRKKIICRHFQRFKTCSFGNDCKFSHEAEEEPYAKKRVSWEQEAGKAHTKGGPKMGSNMCWAWAANNPCIRGQNCRFSHDGPGGGQSLEIAGKGPTIHVDRESKINGSS